MSCGNLVGALQTRGTSKNKLNAKFGPSPPV